ncbi:putative zinc finger protein [Orchesella cincta]|uniref:Putative zinc finger protein n=1 Tax=Orchesella cincta TaxID=48709 RepID=A0A1D2MFK5_ORCCI|nr:putative zinc finger protein [Orchesella cincta]
MEKKANKQKVHQCSKCSKLFFFAGHLKNHIRSHTKSSQLPCDYCEHSFPRWFELRIHLNSVHAQEYSQNKKVKCSTCGKLFKSPALLKLHQQRLHSETRQFSCSHCPSFFSTNNHLSKHIRAIHDSNYRYIQPMVNCCICSQVFTCKGSLNIHMRTHTNEKPYVCSICGQSFRQSGGLKVHFRAHSVEKRAKPVLECILCANGKKFRTYTELQQHIHPHTGEKPFSCSTCGKPFRTLNGVKLHALIHIDSKPFKCSECPLRFRNKYRLKTHDDNIHRRILRFPCRICGKRWYNRGDLNKHIAAHLKEKHHQCHICKRRFSDKNNVSLHLGLHKSKSGFKCPKCSGYYHSFWTVQSHYLEAHVGSPDKLYSCFLCGENKSSLNKLEDHTAFHTRERPYFCNSCPNTFRNRDSLRVHMLKYHGTVLTKMKDSVPQRQKKKIHKNGFTFEPQKNKYWEESMTGMDSHLSLKRTNIGRKKS